MDKTPDAQDWIVFLQTLPEKVELLRMDDGNWDGFFQVEVWMPRDVHKMSKLLAQFPEGTVVEEITNVTEEDLCIRLMVRNIFEKR
jgi:hypothetical protein